MATALDITSAMLMLHADMHLESETIRDLLAEKVPTRTILSLYPLDARVWDSKLKQHLKTAAVREHFLETRAQQFIYLSSKEAPEEPWKWISRLKTQHGNALHAIYHPMGQTQEARALVRTIIPERDRVFDRDRVHMRMRSIRARMVIADHWAELPEHHGHEDEFLQVLEGMRNALSL